jgi:transcriptional regulator with XRE-family HTH domain
MGLTNVQVAELLGVVYQTIERWEHDRTPITAKNRGKIIRFLGYDPDYAPASPSS